jgi:hypothetical protein
MKKLISILICLVIVTGLLSVPLVVYAEEISTEFTENISGDKNVEITDSTDASEFPEENDQHISETIIDETFDEPTAEPDEDYIANNSTYHTLFTRIWEFVTANKSDLFTVIGSLILIIFNIVSRNRDKKSDKKTNESINSMRMVVGAANGLISGYNNMKDSYDKYGQTEDERNRITGANLVTNMAILEILVSVYSNSKNLPQGVKDIVNLKYANCLKQLDDDAQLVAIVNAVRNNIGTMSTLPSETDVVGTRDISGTAANEISEV